MIKNDISKKILAFLKEFLREQAILLLLSLLAIGTLATRPFLIRYLIDNVIVQQEINLLLPFFLALVSIISLERVFSYAFNLFGMKTSLNVLKNLESRLYSHIQMLPPKWLLKNPTGELMSRTISDAIEFSGISVVIVIFIANLINLSVISLVLCLFSLELSLIVFASLPLYYLVFRKYSEKLQQTSSEERETYALVTESLREKIEGVVTIKGLSKKKFFRDLFLGDVNKWIKQRENLYATDYTLRNITFYITAIVPAVVLGYGGIKVVGGAITLGTLLGFFSYVGLIYEPIYIIVESITSFQRAKAPAKRVFEVLDLEVEESHEKLKLPAINVIEYKNVDFAYDDKIVLKGINLKINAKETVAIVGATGSGKSTMINLLPRFYDPSAGMITINEKDLKEYSLDTLRKNALIVRQNDYLFNMSIIENITLGDNFSRDKVEEVTKLTGVHEFIANLPKGYNSLVGERGVMLSDGQKQRVALARAVIRMPSILLLDEATSALDAEIEKVIFHNIRTWLPETTIIIVSHRLSTILMANRIIVLEDGKIVGKGKHDELMKKCSTYENLIRNQLLVKS